MSFVFDVRQADAGDLPAIRQLFADTVTYVNARHYDFEQVAVWARAAGNELRWLEKLRQQYFVVAGHNGSIAGFASISSEGYLDFLYVHRDHQRKGIAQALLAAIEEKAISVGNRVIESDVSITARPFFEKNGFVVVRQQTVKIEGIALINFRMKKQLLE